MVNRVSSFRPAGLAREMHETGICQANLYFAPPVPRMRVPVVRFRLLKKNLRLIERASIHRHFCQPKVEVSKPAWNKSGPRKLDGPFEVLRCRRIILLLSFQVAQTTENLDPLTGASPVRG